MPTALEQTGLMSITQRPELVLARGRGSWVWDERGRRYLDFVQGWAVNCLGHAPSEVRGALTEQAGRLLTPSPAFHNRPQLELARALTECTGLERVFFCSTGAEANEGAIKLARKWGRVHRAGACEIVTTHGAFHGRTLATMAASGKPGWDELFPPRVEGFAKVPFGDAPAARAAVNERSVAIWVEPIQGEEGVVVPPSGYLAALRSLCDERGLLLMLDEIQTGMGRTGSLLACEAEGVRPDILTLGKGLGGGVPLSAMLAREEVACFEPGEQGGTFNGNPLMTAVGLAVLGTLTAPGFLRSVEHLGDRLRAGLEGLAIRYGCPFVRGRGLLLALGLPRPAAREIVAGCRERGLLINAPAVDLLRFMPSLRVEPGEIDDMCNTLDAALAQELALARTIPEDPVDRQG